MVTLSKGGQELGRLSDAEESHKRKHADIFLNRWPVQHGESWMRQRSQTVYYRELKNMIW